MTRASTGNQSLKYSAQLPESPASAVLGLTWILRKDFSCLGWSKSSSKRFQCFAEDPLFHISSEQDFVSVVQQFCSNQSLSLHLQGYKAQTNCLGHLAMWNWKRVLFGDDGHGPSILYGEALEKCSRHFAQKVAPCQKTVWASSRISKISVFPDVSRCFLCFVQLATEIKL